jgi:hypothetical protein
LLERGSFNQSPICFYLSLRNSLKMEIDIQAIKNLPVNERRAWLHELLDSFAGDEAWAESEIDHEMIVSEDVVELLLQREREVESGKEKPVSVNAFEKAMHERFGEKWQKH